MYYDRTLSNSFSKLLEPNGELRWLFDLVANRDDLDFLIGKNSSKEWISVYRGLSRVLTILKTKNPNEVRIDGAEAYKNISNTLYGIKNISNCFHSEIIDLIDSIAREPKFDRYYKNKKEGYYQNLLSRRFGINGQPDDEFVILDKESVIGYENLDERKEMTRDLSGKYKELLRELSEKNSKRYGRDLGKKSIGNELDFIALDKHGNLLLIEYKHATNTSGLFLSPFQIGMYFDLFNQFPREELIKSALAMLDQKKRIGLVNSKWGTGDVKNIVPMLIVSDYKEKSSAKTKYNEVMDFLRHKEGVDFLKDIKTYNYTIENGITSW